MWRRSGEGMLVESFRWIAVLYLLVSLGVKVVY